jgi:hypothetical protein
MGNVAAEEKRLQAISRKINYHSATACTARGVVEKQRNNVLFTISNHLFFPQHKVMNYHLNLGVIKRLTSQAQARNKIQMAHA